MEKRAREFLNISSKYYEQNKEKWTSLLTSIGLVFDEDVYNDTIIRVYDKMVNDEDIDKTEEEVIAYWFKSFVNNVKREKKYSRNSKRDDSDVIELLRNEEYIIEAQHLYYPTIRMLLEQVKKAFEDSYFQAFKMYYLTDITIEELNEVMGCNCKPRITKMKKFLKDNVE